MPIQTSFTGINPNFRLIKNLFVFTVILLPVTLCHSIRPIWLNPPPPPPPSPSSSSNSFPADSINSVDSLNDYIQTSRLLDAIAANDLSSIDSDFEPSLDVDVNRNNLDGNVNPFSKDFAPQNSNLHIKTSSSPTSSIFNLNKEQNLYNIDSNSSNNSGTSSLLSWIEPELITTAADDKSDKKMLKRGNEERSVSRIKKALSLFAHWKPTYKQHLDDAYSSELVSAVSRGHGRTAGQALRWG
ncbi:uncharacterized protein LOC107367472 [Tetranychus urticae]|uniref:uncharacterized protein LOC107367472 n=1 Tax=Tetranychus urticae TaxID=32264 RepID=UPI00077B9D9F|nr:uncharacterized protein LOC107367472 [Tetranychus urticae]XP_015790660.1 uncharacterized protein LOC107367472 [Tetranychus urticae]